MPRQRQFDDLVRSRKRLANDARVIWILHQKPQEPMTIEEVADEFPKESGEKKGLQGRLKDEIFPLLLRKEIIKKKVQDGVEKYVLKDIPDPEIEVFWAIVKLARNYQAWPDIDDIALEAGLSPRVVEKVAYKLHPITGWRPPKRGEYPDLIFLKRLELAAWLKVGCNDLKFLKSRWTDRDRELARHFLKMYPSFVPTIRVFRYGVEKEQRFRYTLEWPGNPSDIPVDYIKERELSREDYPKCTGLKIEEEGP